MKNFIDELNNFENLLEIKDQEEIKEEKTINDLSKIRKIQRDCEQSHKRFDKLIYEMNSKIDIVNDSIITMYENIQIMTENVNNIILLKTKTKEEEKEKETIFNIDSNILEKLNEFDLINNKLEDIYKKKIRYELLFRATTDGGFGKIFKRKCSRIRRTLILVQSKKNKKFGGFTEAIWNDSNKGHEDENTFCFSLNKNKIYTVKKNGSSIYCKENAGPIFCDIFGINSNFAYEGGYAINLEIEKTKYNNITEDFELSGEQYFEIQELEVFKIKPIFE